MADKKHMSPPPMPPGPGGPGRGGRQAPPQKPKNALKTLLRIFAFMGRGAWLFVPAALSVLFSSILSVNGTSMLEPIIDDILTPMVSYGMTGELTGNLKSALLKMAALFIASALFTFITNRLTVIISSSALFKIRFAMFERLESLPIKYFDTHSHGQIMSRFTNDVDALRQLISNSLLNLLSNLATVIAVFIMMVRLSPLLTVVVCAMMAIMLVCVGSIAKKSGGHFASQQRSLGAVNGYIEEMISGQKAVKAFCREERLICDFEKINDRLADASAKANIVSGSLMPIMANLGNILYALCAAAGSALALGGTLSVGAIVTFLQYTRTFSHPITQMSQQMTAIMSALAGAERIFELIDQQPETDDGYVTLVRAEISPDGSVTETKERTGKWAWKHPHHSGGVSYTELKGDVRFEDVTFSYDGERDVLSDVSLYAKPGQKIAFVGSTGAGKTTVTNLINRFYDVPDGKIRYDGININKIKKSDLRRSLAMVLQDTHLFTGTVRDNIRYGKLDATDEEVERAAKIANADGFIRRLPDGYDTVLTGDGANLSQGQRQLLAIARAAVADPPVLILDEATSSIDTRTEKLIEKGMDRLMHGRTVFVIAHRLSTVRNADAIMVLENGRIIERGDHNELIARRAKYYSLYTGAFELD